MIKANSVVSIHASVKDATLCPSVSPPLRCFNPRVREGRDVMLFPKALNETIVSIHASVKDATLCRFRGSETLSVSIHASVKDATIQYRLHTCHSMFQSTRP